jgi:pilus assembly protein Flp/PilA
MRRLTTTKLLRFLADETGTTAIEYAVIASGIACAIIVLVTASGESVKGMFTSVSNGFK